MTRSMILRVFAANILLAIPAFVAAVAQSPTPIPTPEAACYDMQHCVDAAVPPIVTACRQGIECNKDNDKFAITANQLSERAILKMRCNTRTFKKRATCVACYNAAKSLISAKMDTFLFHGFLSFANWNIRQAMLARCDNL